MYVHSETLENQLWEIWLAKDIEVDFETFKKKAMKNSGVNKPISKEEEQEIMRKAERILNMTRKGE